MIVANGIPIFWITINLANLQCPSVIRLANVKDELFSKIQSIFHFKIATINLVTEAKFFYILCNVVFISLFAVSQTERELLGLILNYFAIVKTNGYRMLYHHYLVWLKNVLYLATLRSQIQNNVKFYQKLLLFL